MKIYEFKIRFTMTEDEHKISYFFFCFPTKNDVFDAIEKQRKQFEAHAGKESSDGFVYDVLTIALGVVASQLGGWFEVGACGGRPSSMANGYISVEDHNLIDNNW